MDYHILIVEDRLGVCKRQVAALTRQPTMGIGLQILSVSSVAAAQLQAARQHFHLIIALLQRRNGVLELARNIKVISPDTRMLLLRDQTATAFETACARALVSRVVGAETNPEEFSAAVRDLLVGERAPEVQPASTSGEASPAEDVNTALYALLFQSNATLVLYTDKIGHIIAHQGDETKVEVSALASLIAGSFINALELARILRDPETAHFSMHEGRHYNVYSANVGSDRLLVLAFDKQIAAPKIGSVMLTLKRCAERLQHMELESEDVPATLDQQFSQSLNSEFDRVFARELMEQIVGH